MAVESGLSHLSSLLLHGWERQAHNKKVESREKFSTLNNL